MRAILKIPLNDFSYYLWALEKFTSDDPFRYFKDNFLLDYTAILKQILSLKDCLLN